MPAKVQAEMHDVGAVLQVVNTHSGAVATGTTVIPNDDTLPQNTEGKGMNPGGPASCRKHYAQGFY